MKNNFYEYLKSLSKEELILLIYKPRTKFRLFPIVSTRTIALRISYDGKSYSGVSPQAHKNTIGGNVENALRLCGLSDKLTWAGRTDAGVSAVNMIASLKVGSRLAVPNNTFTIKEEDYNEYKYDLILNNYLPPDIRVTGWAPVPDDFSARFDCIQRCYRYYFSHDGLDFEKMQGTVDKIKRMTNFFLLSKHSDENARYERTLDELVIVREGSLCYLSVKARAFLHNMVRKIFWLVRQTGKGSEFSLDNVAVAPPYPLVFCGAVYPTALTFIGNDRVHEDLKEQYNGLQIQTIMAELRIKDVCMHDK